MSMKTNIVVPQSTKTKVIKDLVETTKEENRKKGSLLKCKLTERSGCDIVKGTAGSRFEARFIKNEWEAFLLYINEDMISRIVERTNEQMREDAK